MAKPHILSTCALLWQPTLYVFAPQLSWCKNGIYWQIIIPFHRLYQLCFC
jgi:hypothetical protein